MAASCREIAPCPEFASMIGIIFRMKLTMNSQKSLALFMMWVNFDWNGQTPAMVQEEASYTQAPNSVHSGEWCAHICND